MSCLATPTAMPYEGWLSPASAEAILARIASGTSLPTDKYYLRPREILTDAGMVPADRQTRLLREQRTQTLLLCSRQSRPSFLCSVRSSRSPRGRRHPNLLPQDRRPRARSI